jgi:hypothetical protein
MVCGVVEKEIVQAMLRITHLVESFAAGKIFFPIREELFSIPTILNRVLNALLYPSGLRTVDWHEVTIPNSRLAQIIDEPVKVMSIRSLGNFNSAGFLVLCLACRHLALQSGQSICGTRQAGPIGALLFPPSR